MHSLLKQWFNQHIWGNNQLCTAFMIPRNVLEMWGNYPTDFFGAYPNRHNIWYAQNVFRPGSSGSMAGTWDPLCQLGFSPKLLPVSWEKWWRPWDFDKLFWYVHVWRVHSCSRLSFTESVSQVAIWSLEQTALSSNLPCSSTRFGWFRRWWKHQSESTQRSSLGS